MAMSKEKQKNKVHSPLRHGARNFQPTPLFSGLAKTAKMNSQAGLLQNKKKKGGWKPHQVSMASAHVVLDNPARKGKKKSGENGMHAHGLCKKQATTSFSFHIYAQQIRHRKEKKVLLFIACPDWLEGSNTRKQPNHWAPPSGSHYRGRKASTALGKTHRPACGTRCAAQCWLRLSHIVSKT